jgi:hypothetical protein
MLKAFSFKRRIQVQSARRIAGLEPGISLQKYSENTREIRLFDWLVFVPRAFLRIFHRDGPDSSHCSLLGLNSPCCGEDYLVPGRSVVVDFPATTGRAQRSQQVR